MDDIWGCMRKVSMEETEKICKLYCEEENVELTSSYIESARLTYKKMLDKGDYIFGAFDSYHNLLGCLSVHFLDDVYPGYTNGPYMHIETIIIGKNFRGKGIATALLKQMLKIAEFENVTYCIAQTGDSNIAMRKAYENAGFENRDVNYAYDFVKCILNT